MTQTTDYKANATNAWASDFEVPCNIHNAKAYDFKPLTEWGTFNEIHFAIEQLIYAGKCYFIECRNGSVRDDTGKLRRRDIIRLWTSGNIPRATKKELGQLPI